VQRSGCTPIAALTGEEALAILRDRRAQIDWLLVDIKLPGSIDGWVVGSEFALTHPTRPVIYMSSVEEDSASRRASNSIFLTKPVDANELVTTFHRLGCVSL
jgi:DNA-binding response OmpR family regulator